MGGIRSIVTSACDPLLTYTALFKDDAHKQKRRIERSISNGTRPFQLNMIFHVCDKLTYTVLFKDGARKMLVNKNKGLKEEYLMEQDLFS